MAKGRSGSRRGRRKRSRSPRRPVDADAATDRSKEPYSVEVLTGKNGSPQPLFEIQVDDAVAEGAGAAQTAQRVVPHVCARQDEGYAIRVTNASPRHIACAVTVDGENALLKDGSLIVAPNDSRVLPGFLVSKNFVGREYVKEYRDFRFGKPKVVEGAAETAVGEEQPYTTYGRILCKVFEAVLDEEVGSDQEMSGQNTHYRGAGLNGSFEDRLVPEGKKKHFLYSSVTVQGPRSAISNSTRGRWWVRGTEQVGTLELRYREAHSLMLLGVDPRALGMAHCKDEGEHADASKKEEELDEKFDKKPGGPDSGYTEVCDLTADVGGGAASSAAPVWSLAPSSRRAEPVDIERVQ